MKWFLDIKAHEMIRFPESICVHVLACREDVIFTLYGREGEQLAVVKPGVLKEPVLGVCGLKALAPVSRLIVE